MIEEPLAPPWRAFTGWPEHKPPFGHEELLWRICLQGDPWTPPSSGGRWSHPGEPMIYASLSPALAALEALVHRDDGDLRQPHRLACVEAPAGPRLMLPIDALPASWLRARELTRTIGSQWLQSQSSALLFVPSAVVPHACNALINAAHPLWQPTRLHPQQQSFCFDARLQ